MKALLHVGPPFAAMLMAFTATFAAPVALSLFAGDGEAPHFLQGAVINLCLGAALWYATRHHRHELRTRDGFLLLAPLAVVMAATAALPLLFGTRGLSFTDAYFEAMSGLTSSGATVLSGIDTLPASVKLWRSELNWIGGLGTISVAIGVLPLLGVGGMQLHRSETPGPASGDKLLLRLQQAVRALLPIYFTLTAICAVALKLAGMNWLDAICHAMSTLSLGGFSTHDANIAYFHSPLIESVIAFFMLVAGISFVTHYGVWTRRRLRDYWRDRESRTYLVVILVSCVAIAIYLFVTGTDGAPLTALRHSAFNVISLATDCGFVSDDYDRWPLAAPLWMLLLSCGCACSASAGGGIKMIRTLILFRQSTREIRGLLHPSSVQTLKIGRRPVRERVVLSVLAFIHLYTLCVVLFTLLLIIGGAEPVSAFSAIIAAINNNAHGLRAVGPGSTFAGLSDFQTWVCTAAMLIGRLEIFVVILPFTPAFWRE